MQIEHFVAKAAAKLGALDHSQQWYFAVEMVDGNPEPMWHQEATPVIQGEHDWVWTVCIDDDSDGPWYIRLIAVIEQYWAGLLNWPTESGVYYITVGGEKWPDLYWCVRERPEEPNMVTEVLGEIFSFVRDSHGDVHVASGYDSDVRFHLQ